MRYLKYLRYIVLHKWFVMLECFRVGLIWRGIVHDWTKFTPREFIPYANHFYGGEKTVRSSSGYYNPRDTGDIKFDMAWFWHQKRNDHHWQYWITPRDVGEPLMFDILDMPLRCRMEMLCDWKGAGRVQKTPGVLHWYSVNGRKIRLHENTRRWIEKEIGYRR